jgi:DNA-binding NarL/FixJ family response regulator
MSRLGVLIADNHRLFAEGLRALLSDRFDVLGLSLDGIALVRAVDDLEPDLVLLDVLLPKLHGLEAVHVIHRKHPNIKILLLTAASDLDQFRAARRAGASGYVPKSVSTEELIKVIEEVTSEGRQRTARVKKVATGPRTAPRGQADPGPASLTPRQREVLQLTVQGLSAREIGEVLSISTKTVEFHKAELRKALRISSTAELIRYALKHRIVA